MSGLLVFAYHDLGYQCLQFLLNRQEHIPAVFSHQNDQSENLYFRSVADLARSHHIPVYTPEDVNSEKSMDFITDLAPDLVFSFTYRRLLDQKILDLPTLGAFNIHPSLLPKYRGRAPVNWAIINGETETGATLHAMTAKADAGGIVDQMTIPIGETDTAITVMEKVVETSVSLLEKNISALKTGKPALRHQDETAAFYVGRRRPADGRINWRLDCRKVFNLIRAVTHPYPGAFTEVAGARLIIWWAEPRAGEFHAPGEIVALNPLRIACQSGALECRNIQWVSLADESETNPPPLQVGQQIVLDQQP